MSNAAHATSTSDPSSVRLTQYSHGAGCGCKIAPDVLEQIVHRAAPRPSASRLIVGHDTSDDAAVYDLGNDIGIVSTTDFFMPIVDDPHTFGRIAVTNALSDVYAMGGVPLMAIAILGWPLDRLAPTVARAVVEGGRAACAAAEIELAGGHSIDAPEPIFGAAITGSVRLTHLKRNSTAREGDRIYLTKPLGIGVLTTAEKKGLLEPAQQGLAAAWMTRLNDIGPLLAPLPAIHAMTDVTGFGLAGHLIEMCRGAGLSARVIGERLPLLDGVARLLEAGCAPGGTARNHGAYGRHLGGAVDAWRDIVCDPQTSGGLLVAIDARGAEEAERVAAERGVTLAAIGEFVALGDGPMIALA